MNVEFKQYLDIKQYTVALYREKHGVPSPIGSGILVIFQGTYYLISAYHVFDMEEEQLKVKNDPEESGIIHDDMECIMAKSNNDYFYINDFMKSLVFSVHYNQKSKQPILNEDTEWCVCRLTDEMVQHFTEAEKKFYSISDKGCPQIKYGDIIIASGYPQYAQKENKEEYRSFYCEMLECEETSKAQLFRVKFDNQKAYNIEKERDVHLPNYGIAGMSGGGLWHIKENKYFPIGIILKQDPNNKYIEGFWLDSIFKGIQEGLQQ